MNAQFEVAEEEVRQFNTKTGPRKEYTWHLRDKSPGVRSTTPYTYALTDEERDKHWGKCRDQIVEVAISKHSAGFNGTIRCEGSIASVGSGVAKPPTNK